MASKKIPIGLDPSDDGLAKRVDSMMAPVKINVTDHGETSAEQPPASPSGEATTAVPPIDIFSDPKTAPAVPADLLKKLGQPVEMTKSIDPEKPAVVPITPARVAIPIAGIADKVPQLIASTAPKIKTAAPQPAAATNVAGRALETEEAAPAFTSEDTPTVSVNAENDATTVEATIPVPPLKIDDAKSDAAVAAITVAESDEVLAAEDAAREQASGVSARPKKLSTHTSWLKRPWFYLISLLIILAVLAALPTTRYKIAGLVFKQNLQVIVMDAKTSRPVSKAAVLVDGHSGVTDATGHLVLDLPVGSHSVSVSKEFYSPTTVKALLDFKKGSPLDVLLVATGRQVPLVITDKLSGHPIPNAEVTILGTSAKTDAQGKTLIVLPTKTSTVTGSVSAGGFNTTPITVQVTDMEIAANSFALAPAGKVYFLSNDQGTIDIVKTNLDGSERQTVLKGTGREDPNSTILLSARDWRYSILKAQRDGTQPALYMLDSATDKLVEFDSGDANFTPIGWSGHSFVYDAVRNSVATSQSSHELIKSYDAERGQLNQLDASQATAIGAGYAYQGFYNFYLLDIQLIYNTQWYSSGGVSLAGKMATIRGVQASGQSKKDYQSIPSVGLGYIQAALANPQDIYFSAYNYNDSKTTYYEFQGQNLLPTTQVDATSFNKLYPTYLASPGGKQSIWTDTRNGKKIVMIGDSSAANPQAVPNLAGFSAYGWYSDNYLIVSKGSSELYIIASNGNGSPLKIADYYKPAKSLGVYGFGYGGL